MKTPDRSKAARLLRYQLYMLPILVMGAWLFGGKAALSALLGGGLALVVNLLFAALVFGAYKAAEPGKLATRLYAAEVAKLLFVALAFAAIFLWIRPLNVAALFVTFFLVQVGAPLLAHLLPTGD